MVKEKVRKVFRSATGNNSKKSRIFSSKEKDLVRRYLIWCYKTTKESLDRIDRYYTQIEVDHYVLDELNRTNSGNDPAYQKLVDDFRQYIVDKKKNVDQKKFVDDACTRLQPHYRYLSLRFLAIEKAIVRFLGSKELSQIRHLYEEEMTSRILTSREHT